MDDDIFDKLSYSSNVFDFEVDGYKFSCEELTVGEEAMFYNYYIAPNGRENLAKLGLCRATRLITCPFESNNIKKILSIEKDWCDLSLSERLSFLEKLESKFTGKILKNINNYYTEKTKEAKNL